MESYLLTKKQLIPLNKPLEVKTNSAGDYCVYYDSICVEEFKTFEEASIYLIKVANRLKYNEKGYIKIDE